LFDGLVLACSKTRCQWCYIWGMVLCFNFITCFLLECGIEEAGVKKPAF